MIRAPLDFGPLQIPVYSDGHSSESDFVADDPEDNDEMEVDEEWNKMLAKRTAKKKLPKVSHYSHIFKSVTLKLLEDDEKGYKGSFPRRG